MVSNEKDCRALFWEWSPKLFFFFLHKLKHVRGGVMLFCVLIYLLVMISSFLAPGICVPMMSASSRRPVSRTEPRGRQKPRRTLLNRHGMSSKSWGGGGGFRLKPHIEVRFKWMWFSIGIFQSPNFSLREGSKKKFDTASSRGLP